MRLSRLFIFALIFLGIACQDEPVNVIVKEEPIMIEVDEIIPDGSEQYLNLDSDYIFDQEKVHTFELIIPEENYNYINSDPAAEEYVEAQLVFEGDTISPVGVRYKGSIGAYVNCLSGGDFSNPTGYKTCRKLSMKVKINWEGREDNFYKLKKLQFHSMNNDPTQMRDRLGYHLFRSMDIPGPRAVHARLMINGSYNGLFSLVEQIDGRFAKYNFDDDDGNVYKEIWPLSSLGEPFPTLDYIKALKTNEEIQDVSFIQNFSEALASANGEVEVQSIIEQYLDLDEMLAYCVVDRTIRHDDGPFHWYCGNNSICSPHNFYWYEEPNEQKLHLIPWDLDNAFENIIIDRNPVTPIFDPWGQITNDCQPFEYGLFDLTQWSAACDVLTGGLASYEDLYAQKLEHFKAVQLAEINTTTLIDNWSAQIYTSTQEANELDNSALSILNWQIAIGDLKNQIEFARDN